MSYNRVLPRDAFNEANMLKCLGQLALLIHEYHEHDPIVVWTMTESKLDNPYAMDQDPTDGDLYFTRLKLVVNDKPHTLCRPMNSRLAYPMYMYGSGTDGPLDIFDSQGKFAPEFLAYCDF